MWSVALLAGLGYFAALTAAPGRMPADSKLYVYLDPGRFLGDAASTFDQRQFGGWVPHQHVAYLWPTDPWFWFWESIGVPDWIAHRLWIGTLMVAAGLGVFWCARQLRLTVSAATVAALVYQLSPYVLPYVSRTSVMLLPWAGLGWIVAFTIRATRRSSWADPAAIALVVCTVGAVNATALAMIVPAPVLWLLHARWQRIASWAAVARVALRTGLLSVLVSMWWVVMLVIQGRFGADVLPYSESLGDVSLTATSTEVWRGMGYWLFYIRDPFAATTSASLRYLISSVAIVISFAVPVLCLVGLVVVRWAHRQFAALLVAAGVILAVGVHPIDDKSPLMRLLAGDDGSGLALALRSSTRALPLLALGLALAGASMVTAAGAGVTRRRTSWLRADRAIAVVLGGLAIANLPALWTGGFVDPALERDQDPPDAWIEAAAALDARGAGARVVQLPGAEFGAFRWGYTVDQPLPGLTDKPLITRDLLPLGSAGVMDLTFALDDRFQDGVFEPGSLAPVARLLGVDTVWSANDAAFDRFRTARPEIVRDELAAAPGTTLLASFGNAAVNRADVPFVDGRSLGDPRVGEPMPTVELYGIDDPVPTIRAKAPTLIVSGSGDGLVDAAAAGLIDGTEAIWYSASANGDDQMSIDEMLDRANGLIVTDANRDRARHWRSSQDTAGYTEPGGPDQDVLDPVASDQRLPLFETSSPESQTTATQRGPIVATATSYGQPFAYLPEHRPFAAVDGDPSTAWTVGEHGDPVGEVLRLEVSHGVESLSLVQAPTVPGGRRIQRVSVDIEDPDGNGVGTTRLVELGPGSAGLPGQRIELPELGALADGGVVEITIDEVDVLPLGTSAALAGVGFAEVADGVEPTIEVVTPPHDALAALDPATPLALAFTRLRVDPMDRWRADPEASLVREFRLPHPRTFSSEVTVRVDPNADDSTLADWFGWPAAASTRLAGSLRDVGVAAIDGDLDTAWTTGFDEALGATLTITGTAAPIDQITVRQSDPELSRATALTVTSGDERRDAILEPSGDDPSRSVARLDPPLPPGTLDVAIAEIEPATTVDRRFGDTVVLPVSIDELEFDGRPAAPTPAESTASATCTPLLDLDGAALPVSGEVDGSDWLDGKPIVATPCEPELMIREGEHLLRAMPTALPLVVDRVVFDDGIRSAAATARDDPPTVDVVDLQKFSRQVEVRNCPAGCWLVLGEGFNPAWKATGPDGSLGDATMIDGGFNGWWIEPAATTTAVTFEWTAQRPLNLGLILSGLAVLGSIALLLVSWRRRRTGATPGVTDHTVVTTPVIDITLDPVSRSRAVVTGVAWALSAGILIDPEWALWGALGGAIVLAVRRLRVVELTALSCLGVAGVLVVWIERRNTPFPGGGWPSQFESLHGLGMFAVVSVLVGALMAPAPERADGAAGASDPATDPPSVD